MFCDRCGALNESGSLLCLQCGTALSEPAPKAAPAKEEKPSEPIAAVEEPPAPAPPPPEHPCPAHADMPVAGTCPRCGKFVCARCAPRALDNDLMCGDCLARTETPGGDGIGGWLIFPAITVVLTPLVGLFAFFTMIAFAPLQAVLYGGLGGYGIFCAINFFQHKRSTPMLMIGLYIASAVIGVADGNPVRGMTLSVIWIAYFLRSERVKRTFVR